MDWQSIISEHGPLVWRTAYRLLDNEEDTNDCFQDVFLAAVDVSRRENIRNVPALLNHLATCRAITLLRNRARNARAISRVAQHSVCGLSSPPKPPLEIGELTDQIRLAIAELPSLEAQAFCLRVFNDLSYRRIAVQLNVNSGYVGVLINRAKKKLRCLFPAVNEINGSCSHE